MDNLRNIDGNGGFGTGEPNYVSYEDEDVTSDPPPAIGQDERRMHVRAYNFWAGLLGERQFPNVEDLDPETDQDFGSNSVLLDFTHGVENPAIPFLGDSLREECGIGGEIQTIEDVPARSLLSRITDHYLQIIANQAPIGFEAEFVNQRGITIMYRGILLPFSTDDDTIDFIYGVINWKEVAEDDITKVIEEEVTQAVRSAPAKRETGPIWADGPTSGGMDNVFDDGVVEHSFDENASTNSIFDDEPTEDASLSDWLSAARNSADHAADTEQRSRAALYSAIGRAYDFYLMTQQHPQDYAQLLNDSGLKVQERAPMTPVVKLVFGVNYDKTRLTEYAAALRFADKAGLPKGSFADYLEKHDGGLKAIVYAERDTRKPEAAVVNGVDDNAAVLDRLRSAPKRELADLNTGDAEFVVLVARRDVNGDLSIVGPVQGDKKLTERVLKHTCI